jgi:hypothetical protein
MFGGDLGFDAVHVIASGMWQKKKGVYYLACRVIRVQG